MRIEIAAATTSGEARNGTRDREDGSRGAHRDCGSNHERKPGMAHETEKTVREKNALAQRLLAIASHRDQRCVSLQADLLRHSVGPAA